MRNLMLGIMMFFIVLTAACGGETANQEPEVNQGENQQVTPDTSSPPAPQQVEEKKQQPVEIYFQNVYSGSPTAEVFLESYGDMIQKKFPHITKIHYYHISQRPLEQIITNKEQVDIIITSQGRFFDSFLTYGFQYDMSSFIKESNYDLNILDPSSLNLIKHLGNGDLYGFPVDAGGTWLNYNKELFEKFGVPFPKDHMTWDEFHELSQLLSRTADGIKYHGSAFGPVNFMSRNPYGLDHLNAGGKADFSDPTWSHYLRQIHDIFQIPGNEKTTAELGTSGAVNLFRKDKTAAMYSPIIGNDISLMLTYEDMDFDITHFPKFKDAPGNVQTYPNIYALSSTSTIKNDAFDVIAYMTSEEVQIAKAKKGYFPALNNQSVWEVFGQDMSEEMRSRNLKVFSGPNQYVTPSNLNEYTSTANAELNKTFTEVITGVKDLNTALREAEELATNKIKELIEASAQ